jgi:hypothetical protein
MREELRVSPLRFASVEMTELLVVGREADPPAARKDDKLKANSRSFASLRMTGLFSCGFVRW